MTYSAAKEAIQRKAVASLEAGEDFNFSVWSTFDLQDLEFAAEIWNSPIANAAILAELDRRP